MMTVVRNFSVLAAVVALAACQTIPPENADLNNARAAVAEAAANPYTARSGAVELERARLTLRRAENSWAEDRDADEIRHLSYLVQRGAQTASALAAQAQAEERMQKAGAERERMRAQARSREADTATLAARTAEERARQERAAAEAAQGRAAQSQREADAARQQLALAAERAAALERDLRDLQSRPTPRGMVVTLGDVLFATGRAELQPGAQRSVQQMADVLREHPERRVLVEGFTDSTGSSELNQTLSWRRAESLRQALLRAGVAADRIEVRGHGAAFPVADNATASGRQQNRRVEVLFSDQQGRFAER